MECCKNCRHLKIYKDKNMCENKQLESFKEEIRTIKDISVSMCELFERKS